MKLILSRIRQEAYEQGYQDGIVDGYNLAGTLMSSAKQERKRGKWIKAGRRGFVTYSPAYAECSCCHAEPTFLGWTMRYCPSCGAEMKGDDE